MSTAIDLIWDFPKVPTLLPKELTSKIKSWLGARVIQSACKQASGIVRGTRKKQEKRKWKIQNLIDEGKFKQARKLSRVYEEASVTKPELDNIEPELDERFITIDFNNDTSFDGWIRIKSLVRDGSFEILIPIKKHKHFNKMLEKGKLKKGIRISKHNITFMFEMPKVTPKTDGTIKGLDVGKTELFVCSDGNKSNKCIHGHDCDSICKKMAKKKKGSKAFAKANAHMENYLHWSIKQINVDNTKQLNRENIKNIKKGKRNSREMSHWPQARFFGLLDAKMYDEGVLVVKVNPTYTSQRCSACGFVCKRNRLGKRFKCVSCGFTADADLNASINISLELAPIYFGSKQQSQHNNKIGFYWNVVGQEHIVPVANKPNTS